MKRENIFRKSGDMIVLGIGSIIFGRIFIIALTARMAFLLCGEISKRRKIGVLSKERGVARSGVGEVGGIDNRRSNGSQRSNDNQQSKN